MSGAGRLRTDRLLLREWRDADLEPFARLNADPEVMVHFPAPLSRAQSDAQAARIRASFDESDFGLWALEVPGVVAFAGVVGLAVPRFEAAFTPCVEIGWRLARAYWGRGYATEAAAAAVAYGFEEVGLDEIVSFTVPANDRSRRVMGRLGMRHDSREDFDHPRIAPEHPLARHVLYRLDRGTWLRAAGSDR